MEWSAYQNEIFKAIEETQDSLIIEAVAGCLAGETIIGINRGGKSYQGTISYLVEMMNGGRRSGRVFDISIPTRIRCLDLDAGVIRLGIVESAVFSGMKRTFVVETNEGQVIRATADHKFLALREGTRTWLPLSELKVGMMLIGDHGKGMDSEESEKNQYLQVYRMDAHPFRSVTHVRGVAYYRVPEHRLIVEAELNGIDFRAFVAEIQAGRVESFTFLDPQLVHVHHKDEDTFNNSSTNLVAMPPGEHFRHHSQTNWVNVQARVGPVEIKSIEEWGDEATYDLTMADRACPNFLANGLVVHNSGKTTTIVEAIRHVPESQSVVFLAFNKSIADELRRRVTQPNASCKTLHALGLSAWKRHLQWDANELSVDGKKVRGIVDDMELDWGVWTKDMTKLVGLAKGGGMVPGEWRCQNPECGARQSREQREQDEDCKCGGQFKLTAMTNYHGLAKDEDESWEEIFERYDIDPEEVDLDLVREVLRRSIEQSNKIIDFDDMLYMPIIAGAEFEKADVVFLDEAQDVNGIQAEIVSRMLGPESRVVAVGDPNQSIYGFRGAMQDSMHQIGKRFHCNSLPLSVSYRCPKRVVAKAQEWVSHILPHDDAPEGIVEYAGDWLIRDFQSGDAILCRNSAPIITIAFLLIRNKIAAKVVGRDIGQGLVKLVEKMKAKTLVDLDSRLALYREREVKRAKGNEAKIGALDDKLATIRVFMDEAGPHAGIGTLIQSIEALFGEGGEMRGMVTCSTCHKSKGLEFDRVFILDSDLYMPSRWARQPWEIQQEKNIQYVAATRAKRELRYISTEGLRVKKENESVAASAHPDHSS